MYRKEVSTVAPGRMVWRVLGLLTQKTSNLAKKSLQILRDVA